jgi:hypothetical protein
MGVNGILMGYLWDIYGILWESMVIQWGFNGDIASTGQRMGQTCGFYGKHVSFSNTTAVVLIKVCPLLSKIIFFTFRIATSHTFSHFLWNPGPLYHISYVFGTKQQSSRAFGP